MIILHTPFLQIFTHLPFTSIETHTTDKFKHAFTVSVRSPAGPYGLAGYSSPLFNSVEPSSNSRNTDALWKCRSVCFFTMLTTALHYQTTNWSVTLTDFTVCDRSALCIPHIGTVTILFQAECQAFLLNRRLM